MKRFLFAILLTLAAPPAWAVTTDLLQNPSTKFAANVYIMSRETVSGYQAASAAVIPSEKSDSATWGLFQWGPYAGFTAPFNHQGSTTDGYWTIFSPDNTRQVYGYWDSIADGVYSLILNTYGVSGLGSTVPCNASEVDLSIAPNDPVTTPALPQGLIAQSARPNLGVATQYHILWSEATSTSTHRNQACPSPDNLHTNQVVIFWHNFVTDPTGKYNHTIVYQLVSRDSRGSVFDATNVSSWWKNPSIACVPNDPTLCGLWGMNDSVQKYAGVSPDPVDGMYHSYDIDFKSRLSGIINSPPAGANFPTDPNFRNANNWTPTGVSFQSAVNGEGSGNTQWVYPRWYAVQ